jgi:hypothetical protein
MRVWWPGQDRHVVQDRKRKDRMKRAASIAATTSSPIASVCCFQLPRHLFLPVGVEKDRESSIAQTIIVYECVHILVKVLREIRGLCMKRVEGWMKKKSMEDLEDLEDHRCHLPTVRSPTAECTMQRSPSSFAIYRYFDVQGFVSSQESPLPFFLRIIKESSREVPSSPRTAWFARHI